MADTTKLKRQVGTIDMTPTWSALLPTMLNVLADVGPAQAIKADKKDIIREELGRMAEAADQYIAAQKAMRTEEPSKLDAHYTSSTLVAEIVALRKEKSELVGALREARDHYCANNIGGITRLGCEASDNIHDYRCGVMSAALAKAEGRR